MNSAAAAVLRQNLDHLRRSTDRAFALLLSVQWLGAIAAAIWISPRTWAGTASETHIHVYSALLTGGLLTIPPVFLAFRHPGKTGTRLVIALAQSGFSSLLIHLMGGRIEAHFHVFGSLALLAAYIDWRVIATATVFAGLDHLLRGIYWPLSIFGIQDPGSWRWLEHVAWVAFIDIFLLHNIRVGRRHLVAVAERQAELESTNERIEREVRLRTAELAEARDQAVETTRLKSEFLANMSHEIRTPMNGVLGFVDLLLESELESTQRQHLETVKVSGEALLNVINDILDFSKIEANRLELSEEPFDLRAILETVGDLLSFQAERKDLEFVCGLATSGNAWFMGDGHRLRQVLLNLTGNAIKFTNEGEVVVRGEVIDTDGQKVVTVTVRDSGIGIDLDKQRMLFQPFTQVDGSSTRRFEGTGLGLAISKRLVEMMGGTIGLTSVPGEGSTFRITIPLAHAEPQSRVQERPIGGIHVLSVDDHATNRELVSAILTHVGCTVQSVANARDALTALRQTRFDIVISDMQMPEMDGVEFVRQAQQDGAIDLPPVILATSVGQLNATDARELGLATVLTKPLKRDQLLQSVRESLNLIREQRTESVARQTPPTGDTLERPFRILVAEDNPVNQRVIRERLLRLGHEPFIVENGQQAIDAIDSSPFDLVLMDVQMPVLNGYDATEAIRSREGESGGDGIPIIAVTAHALLGDREKCIDSGMNDYISKPIRAEDLQRVITRWAPRV